MPNIYHVTDARHRIPVIAVAINADVIRLYGLNPIGADSQGKTIITKETLLNDTSYEYYGEVVWSDELNQYCEITLSKSILRTDTTFKAGAQYLWTLEQGQNTLLHLNAIMYPEQDMSQWRYTKWRMMRPLVKFYFHTDNESFLDTDRVYYSTNTDDTLFWTKDTVPTTSIYNDDIPLYPTLTVKTLTNGDVHLHLEYADGSKPTGRITFENTSGLMVSSLPVTNGDAIIAHQYIQGIPFADVLLDYHKIGELYA